MSAPGSAYERSSYLYGHLRHTQLLPKCSGVSSQSPLQLDNAGAVDPAAVGASRSPKIRR